MFKKMLLVFLFLSLFLSIPCCKKKLPTSPDIPDTKSLRINYFTATPEGILPKGVSTLAWSVSNALYVTLQGRDYTIEVAAVDTKKVAPDRDTTYILTASSETNSVFKTVTVKILACVELMRDSVSCQRGLYNEAGDEVLSVRGKVKNVGGKTAYSVMVKVILYAPDGNYLAEKYATFFTVMYPPIGTFLGAEIDIQVHEEFGFYCSWVIKENLEMVEQFDSTHNPYRPDRDPAKCIVITWEN